MATLEAPKKSSRIDLRLTDEQKSEIETAAHINGASVSQWIVTNLMDAARRTIMEETAYRVSTQAFDAFATLLETDATPEFAALSYEKSIWEK